MNVLWREPLKKNKVTHVLKEWNECQAQEGLRVRVNARRVSMNGQESGERVCVCACPWWCECVCVCVCVWCVWCVCVCCMWMYVCMRG